MLELLRGLGNVEEETLAGVVWSKIIAKLIEIFSTFKSV